LLNSDWDFFFICEGRIVWELKGGIRLVADKNEFVLLPPFAIDWRRAPRTRLTFWYCHFNFRLMPGEVMPSIRNDLLGHGTTALLPLTFSRSEAPAVWRAYRNIIQLKMESSDHPWKSERAVIDLVAELTAFAVRRTRRGEDGKPFDSGERQDSRVAALCNRINLNPEFPWRITGLAKSIGLSPGHVHHLFRQDLGTNLKSYIVEARLRKALGLLKDRPGQRRLSIKEISAACGFSSQHFFARQFRKFFQITPLTYRTSAMLM